MPRDSCLARSGGAEWWRTANGRSATPPDAERREREGGEQIVTVGTGGERVRDARVLFGGARESGRHFGTSVVQEAHASGARTPPDQCSAPVYVDVGASSSPSAANSIFLHFYFLKASAGLQPPPALFPTTSAVATTTPLDS